MSGRKARAARQAAGVVKQAKTPTPILDAAYIQAPVGIDPVTKQYRYRSPKQVRAYLEKRIGKEKTAALEGELKQLFAEQAQVAEELKAAAE